MERHQTWYEVSRSALQHNFRVFRELAGPDRRICAVVKSNAYGHGMEIAARAFAEAGADLLGVHALDEALRLRRAGVTLPVLILGYVPTWRLAELIGRNIHLILYTDETLRAISALEGPPLPIHLKVETGTQRQGIRLEDLPDFVRRVMACPQARLTGLTTHFANIEDTTDHSFAAEQLARFGQAHEIVLAEGGQPELVHTACTAAALLFPESYYTMLRVGIGLYGHWPSKETYVSMLMKQAQPVELHPALTWRTRIAQVKEVGRNLPVGYGLTYRTTRPSRIAVLPIGYADGYDRALSNTAWVLVRGQRAPIIGRVCMNLCMADITDIPDALAEDPVTLLGRDQGERITAEDLATWAGTINYEVLARLSSDIPRLEVE